MGISIIFPHAMNPENNRVLDLNLQMLEENTTCEWEPLILMNKNRPDLVYSGWQWMMERAKYDTILWLNTDVVMCKNWNENVLKNKDNADWLGIQLIECGAIGCHSNNWHIDFGRTANTFRRKEFEDFCEEAGRGKPSILRDGFCWYSPSCWSRDWFVKMGGFDLSKNFPHPIDGEFREKCENAGSKFIVVNSYAYHFQRARENMNEKPERI